MLMVACRLMTSGVNGVSSSTLRFARSCRAATRGAALTNTGLSTPKGTRVAGEVSHLDCQSLAGCFAAIHARFAARARTPSEQAELDASTSVRVGAACDARCAASYTEARKVQRQGSPPREGLQRSRFRAAVHAQRSCRTKQVCRSCRARRSSPERSAALQALGNSEHGAAVTRFGHFGFPTHCMQNAPTRLHIHKAAWPVSQAMQPLCRPGIGNCQIHLPLCADVCTFHPPKSVHRAHRAPGAPPMPCWLADPACIGARRWKHAALTSYTRAGLSTSQAAQSAARALRVCARPGRAQPDSRSSSASNVSSCACNSKPRRFESSAKSPSSMSTMSKPPSPAGNDHACCGEAPPGTPSTNSACPSKLSSASSSAATS